MFRLHEAAIIRLHISEIQKMNSYSYSYTSSSKKFLIEQIIVLKSFSKLKTKIVINIKLIESIHYLVINDILKGRNIIGFIKKQRLNWLGHVERMAEDTNFQKIKRWKPMSKRPIGRPKTLWENDVLEDIRNMNVHNWKKMAQKRDSCKKAVEQARHLYRWQHFIRRRRIVLSRLWCIKKVSICITGEDFLFITKQ